MIKQVTRNNTESFRAIVYDMAQANADRPFLRHKDRTYTYRDALVFSGDLAKTLGRFGHVAIISNSDDLSYLSIFAAVISDATFMHINDEWHPAKIADVIEQATPDVIICHADWAVRHKQDIDTMGYHMRASEISSTVFPGHATVFSKRSTIGDRLAEYKLEKGVEDLIYVMFTSGSTGRPKGVPIAVASALHYARSMESTFDIGKFERWLQPADLHFDLSMLTVLTAWITAGEIVAISATQSPFGPRFVSKFAIDNWTSVPSVVARSKSLGLLKPNAMPGLKRSFFCGEALPSDIAAAWQEATPNAPIFNLYGPTEATVSLTWHRFDKDLDAEPIVAIGDPMEGSALRLAPDGEILLGGPQIFHGYLGDPKPIESYLEVDKDGRRWYKTGDRGQRSESGILQFKGRKDWQIKLNGYRIEIEGIEAEIRRITQSSLTAVVPIGEISKGNFSRLCAFTQTEVDVDFLRSELQKSLPSYMVPELIISSNEFPLNSNGKVDRNALLARAEQSDGNDST